jgi:hypothetical protein
MTKNNISNVLTVEVDEADAHIVLTVLKARIIARSAKLAKATPAAQEEINRELEALENLCDSLRYEIAMHSGVQPTN